MFPKIDKFPKMEGFIRYKTSSPAGDLISYLAGVKEMHAHTGQKGIIYQRINMPGVGYADSIHPFQNEEGAPVCMPEMMFKMLRPLICVQPYIEDYRIWKGEEVDFDFDLIRQERYTNQPKGSLNRWYGYIFPEMQTDLSLSWLDYGITQYSYKELTLPAKIIINFTQRYRNHIVTYHWLKPFQDRIVFAGLLKERDIFCREWDIDIPLLQCDNFLQLANEMVKAKFFMGNQSMCFQIAEGLKIPRILETFPLMPNVIPIGENAHDFYHQNAAQYFFHKLLNK